MKIGAKVGLLAAVALAALAPARPALAHAVGVSSGEYRVDGRILYGDLGMAGRELAGWLPAVDADHDGAVDAAEMAAGRDAVARALLAGLTVTADGQPCAGSVDRAWASEGDGGAIFQVHYTCAAAAGRLTLAAPMLAALGPGHRHLARVFRDGRPQARVLDRAHQVWTLDGGRAAGASWSTAWSMLKLGVEHILTGADHLVFLLGLILVGGRPRALIGVVTAFTLAHSITLALAALGIFAPSPRLVEPAIALSIAYVGVENLFYLPREPWEGSRSLPRWTSLSEAQLRPRADFRKRWRITFPFGLIHGFGFAGALRQIALPRAQVPVALVSFNLGVELGQLAVLALALPLTLAARRAPWFGDRGVRALSVAIAVGGGALFVARLFAR